jgi:hypothetical protein
MALVTRNNVYVQPALYFPILHGHVPSLKCDSGGVSAQVENWSKIEVGVSATKVSADHNKISLSNGKDFTYKALVLATGFDHDSSYIKGLEQFENAHEDCNVFIHAIDHKKRAYRNYWHGWRHQAGDFICYSPKFPYKGEGTDFYALYYEHFLRYDKMHQLSSAGSRL